MLTQSEVLLPGGLKMAAMVSSTILLKAERGKAKEKVDRMIYQERKAFLRSPFGKCLQLSHLREQRGSWRETGKMGRQE